MKLEVGKKYKGEDENLFEVLAHNPHTLYYPFIGVGIIGGRPFSWTESGLESIGSVGKFDLIEEYKEPQTGEVWVNVYEGKEFAQWSTRERADSYADSDRIARIKLTYTEGQFDE